MFRLVERKGKCKMTNLTDVLSFASKSHFSYTLRDECRMKQQVNTTQN